VHMATSSRPTSRRRPGARRGVAHPRWPRRGAGLARRWRGPQLVHGGDVEALARWPRPRSPKLTAARQPAP
jgi:hypothetical protein